MPKAFQLKPPARDFFFHVYQAGLASPFSDERVQIEQMIAGSPTASPQKRIERAIKEVRHQLQRLGREGRIDYTRYTTDDGFLVKAGVLFDFFYTYRERFDQLIHDQIQTGDLPIKVLFAAEALTFLRQRGFNEADSLALFCTQLSIAAGLLFYLPDPGGA